MAARRDGGSSSDKVRPSDDRGDARRFIVRTRRWLNAREERAALGVVNGRMVEPVDATQRREHRARAATRGRPSRRVDEVRDVAGSVVAGEHAIARSRPNDRCRASSVCARLAQARRPPRGRVDLERLELDELSRPPGALARNAE